MDQGFSVSETNTEANVPINVRWALILAKIDIPVVPIKGKNPRHNGEKWHETVTTSPDEIRRRFGPEHNVGLFLGDRLIDIDPDTELTRRLWDLCPMSHFSFGRDSLPREVSETHRIFENADEEPVKAQSFYSFQKRGDKPLLEFRTGNRQVMAPGSIHPDTREPIRWRGTYPVTRPPLVSGQLLLEAARLMATIAALAEIWPGPGGRNNFAMRLTGGLVQHGLAPERAELIAVRAARLAGDEEAERRGACASTAGERLAQNLNVEGFTALEELFPHLKGLGRFLCSNLGLAWNQGSPEGTKRTRTVTGGGKRTSNPSAGGPQKEKDKEEKDKADVPVAQDEPLWELVSEVAPVAIRWQWMGRLPIGRLSLLGGDIGLGKSLLTTYMAARITTDGKWPDGSYGPTGQVLFVTDEDDTADTIRPRLDCAGADCTKVRTLKGIKRPDPKGGEALELPWNLVDTDVLVKMVQLMLPDLRLVVIDPIGSYLGTAIDAYRDTHVRSVLRPLLQIAEKFGLAILLVAHLAKSGPGKHGRADDMILGSRAFTALARCTMHLVPDEEDQDRRMLLAGKNNLVRQPPGLAFSIQDGPRIVWEEEPIDMRANDHYQAMIGPRKPPGRAGDAREIALAWITNQLAGGPLATKEVQQRAKDAGVSWATLRRAAAAGGIRFDRLGNTGPWYWLLPGQDIPSEDRSEGGDLFDRVE